MKDKIYFKLILLSLFSFLVIGCTPQKETAIKVGVQNSDFQSENALHDAVRADDLELVEYLIAQKVEINLADQYGYTPLHLAVRLHNTEITKLLIGKGAEVNTTDSFQDTPLLDSTRNDDTKISEMLICSGAHRNVADKHGMSTLNNSSKNHNKYISTLLRVDNLEPYCQKEIGIEISNATKEEICGVITTGYIIDLNLNIHNSENEYGPLSADIDNANNTWCVNLANESIDDGVYTIDALATDYVINNGTDSKENYVRTSPLTIAIDNFEEEYDNPLKICGTITQGRAKSIDLQLTDDMNRSFGNYTSIVNNKKKTWCTNIKEKIPSSEFKVEAFGLNPEDQKAYDSKNGLKLKNKIGIKIDTVSLYNDNTPKICGKITKGDIDKIDVTLQDQNSMLFGPYKAKIKGDKSWCTNVNDELENGKYIITAKGTNNEGERAKDFSNTNIYIIKGLYDALMDEFRKDFKPWGAELDKDTLIFRFKNPSVMFKAGKKDVSPQYKNILSDFFPRYIKVITNYKTDIEKVFIEGHSSSEFSSRYSAAKNFQKNLELSQGRADEVLKYSSSLSNTMVKKNQLWIDATFKALGLSSSQLVFNEDGTENKPLSRRVEIRIQSNEITLPIEEKK